MVHRLVIFHSQREGYNVTLHDAAQVPRLGVQRPIETTETQGAFGMPPTALNMEKLNIWTTLVSRMKCYD